MVKHIILWQLKEDIEDKESVKKGIKENLESLVGKVLDCELDSEESLKGYQKHPAHVAVADTYVRPYTAVRMCMDYEILQ